MPGINIITRDRYGKYQKAATKGAPQTQQVTDRWYLLKNLGEALRKVLNQEYTVLKNARNEHSQIIEPEYSMQSLKKECCPNNDLVKAAFYLNKLLVLCKS